MRRRPKKVFDISAARSFGGMAEAESGGGGQVGHTAECHREFQLGPRGVEGDPRTLGPAGAQRARHGPSDQDRRSAQGQRPQHILTRADATVDQHRHPGAHRGDDRGQSLGGRDGQARRGAEPRGGVVGAFEPPAGSDVTASVVASAGTVRKRSRFPP